MLWWALKPEWNIWNRLFLSRWASTRITTFSRTPERREWGRVRFKPVVCKHIWIKLCFLSSWSLMDMSDLCSKKTPQKSLEFHGSPGCFYNQHALTFGMAGLFFSLIMTLMLPQKQRKRVNMHKYAPIKQSVCLEIDNRKKVPIHVRTVEHLKLRDQNWKPHTIIRNNQGSFLLRQICLC